MADSGNFNHSEMLKNASAYTNNHCDKYEDFKYSKPMELFESNSVVKICAPMVRYSKLPFRMLVRRYRCDLAFTPMIIADSFVKSVNCRDIEFTTCREDRPLVVQFAANNAKEFADATELIHPFADGVDLNCGCPQRWALAEGIGACLIDKPELIKDMVRQARARVDTQDFTVSFKIRIHQDSRRTVELCRQVEKAGVSWINVHGRTKTERCQPVHYDVIRDIKQSVCVPVVANGDVSSLDDIMRIQELTGVDGVMAARAMLSNPAMYAGHSHTPAQCVADWIDLSVSTGTNFATFHHHLSMMLESVQSKTDQKVFNSLLGFSSTLKFVRDNYGIT